MADEHLLRLDVPGVVATGTATYYLDRLDDFRRRNPSERPPSYYSDYGNKCLGQFLTTKPTLSPRGQRWIDDTLELLQEMMEQERRTDDVGFAKMERDDDAFREFAFGTHAQAYQDAGVFELGVSDLWKIARTPDISDLLNDDGLKEIVRLALGQDGPDSLGQGSLARVARSTRRLRTSVNRIRRSGTDWPRESHSAETTD